ncbi:MarR family winged helix-turn-helix transcriptional regulator [Brevibacterium litoralis]|uniref:MarR family winged helix-turn-helix transcriptional regulator n=1 Tax=Brevibacterium litoralis TaxID=3138935 RepID=UPI0032EB58D2
MTEGTSTTGAPGEDAIAAFPEGTEDTQRCLAGFAYSVLALAREIDLHDEGDADLVSLTPTEQLVMRYVDAHHDCAPSEIATATGLKRPNVSSAITSLVGKGMVTRDTAAHDGRGAHIRPTELAAENIRILTGMWARAIADGLPADATPEKIRTVVGWLDEVIGNMARARAAKE